MLVAKEDYESLEETAYLLSSPNNAKRLLKALSRRPQERKVFSSIDEVKIAIGVRAAGARKGPMA